MAILLDILIFEKRRMRPVKGMGYCDSGILKQPGGMPIHTSLLNMQFGGMKKYFAYHKRFGLIQ